MICRSALLRHRLFAVAERLKLSDVATLDRRHFTVVRPKHTTALTLLP